MFPFDKDRNCDIFQRALKEGYSLFVLILVQRLDIDRRLFDEFFYPALVASDLGTIKTLSRINYIKRNSYRWDILYVIVKGGDVEMVKLLLEGGADVNARNPDDRAALHTAAEGGHIDMAKLLLEKGAYVNSKDLAGRTALHAAAGQAYRHCQVASRKRCRRRCEGSFWLNSSPRSGGGRAYQHGQVAYRKGASVDAKDHFGSIALQTAVLGEHVDMLDMVALLRNQ